MTDTATEKKTKTIDVIKFFGSKAYLAQCLGVTRQAVSTWGEFVPASRERHVQDAMTLEKMYRKRRALRPDWKDPSAVHKRALLNVEKELAARDEK